MRAYRQRPTCTCSLLEYQRFYHLPLFYMKVSVRFLFLNISIENYIDFRAFDVFFSQGEGGSRIFKQSYDFCVEQKMYCSLFEIALLVGFTFVGFVTFVTFTGLVTRGSVTWG